MSARIGPIVRIMLMFCWPTYRCGCDHWINHAIKRLSRLFKSVVSFRTSREFQRFTYPNQTLLLLIYLDRPATRESNRAITPPPKFSKTCIGLQQITVQWLPARISAGCGPVSRQCLQLHKHSKGSLKFCMQNAMTWIKTKSVPYRDVVKT